MLESGQIIDRWKVERELGRGATAVVYLVHHTSLGHPSALKVPTNANAGLLRRLMAEGRTQAQLKHPNLVRVTDVLEVGDVHGLLMEYVKGPTLQERIERGPIPLKDVEEWFRAIVAGVSYAHEHGRIHRDLKPANILLEVGADGRMIPKVTDFGLAKAWQDEGISNNTRAGWVMGTPSFMSPEQIDDPRSVAPHSDIFSLGAILYEMVTGHPAFSGETIGQIFLSIHLGRYTRPEHWMPDLPRRFGNVIRACLAVDRQKRLQSGAEILRVLDGEEVALPPDFGGDLEGPVPTPPSSETISVPVPTPPMPPITLPPKPKPGGEQSGKNLDPKKKKQQDTIDPEPPVPPPPDRSGMVLVALGLGLGLVASCFGLFVANADLSLFSTPEAAPIQASLPPTPASGPDVAVAPSEGVPGTAPTGTETTSPPPTTEPTNPPPVPTSGSVGTPTDPPGTNQPHPPTGPKPPLVTAVPVIEKKKENPGTFLANSKPAAGHWQLGSIGAKTGTAGEIAPGSYTVTVYCEHESCVGRNSGPIPVTIVSEEKSVVCWNFNSANPNGERCK